MDDRHATILAQKNLWASRILFLRKVGKFLLVGLPAFLLAIPVNYLLVEILQWPIPLAYAFVLLMQVIINFFFCIFFVFERDPEKNLLGQFILFIGGIAGVRVLDWMAYNLLVYLGAYFLVAQIVNVIFFSFVKYALARKVLEKKSSR